MQPVPGVMISYDDEESMTNKLDYVIDQGWAG